MREDELVCSAVGPQSTEREFTTTESHMAATEARIRADERERIATVLDALIEDFELGAGQSVRNWTLRLAARIARGER